MQDFTGTKIDRYQILEQLGQGGMAIVYKAHDTRLERDVAIKIIRRTAFPPEVLERVLKRFDREAKVLARLTHPNIVGVIDYGEYEASPYLVMPYIQGGSLKEQLGQPVPWRKAIQLILPLAQALEYAHQHQIIHRDLKPSNILITESGQPMLSDFGIAKILELEETQTLTGTGVGIGTPEYMAPEQGMGKEIDGRADVYSLGIVLYELITGQKPYTADTPMGVVFKHLTDPLPNPREKIPDLPVAVEKLLLKSLSKKPEERYDMNGFSQSLSALLSNQNVGIVKPKERESTEENADSTYDILQAPTATGATKTAANTAPQSSNNTATKTANPSPAPKRTGLIIGASLLVGAIALCVIMGYLLQNRKTDKNSQAIMAAAPEATQTTAPLPTKTAMPTKTPTITPQPTPAGGGTGEIVFLSDTNINIVGINDLQKSKTLGNLSASVIRYGDSLIEVINRESITIKDSSYSACSGLCNIYNDTVLQTRIKTSSETVPWGGHRYNNLVQMPNCHVVSKDDKGFYTIKCTEGYSSIFYPNGNTDINRADYYPVWHPEGGIFAYESFRSHHYEIVTHNIRTQQEVRLTTGVDQDTYHPAWSADGRKIAFVVGKRESKEPSQICYVTVIDQKVTCITDTMTNKDYPAWSPDGQFLVYSEYLGGNYELMVIDINGQNTIQLTDNNVDDILGLWLR